MHQPGNISVVSSSPSSSQIYTTGKLDRKVDQSPKIIQNAAEERQVEKRAAFVVLPPQCAIILAHCDPIKKELISVLSNSADENKLPQYF